jgi:hypothetical protein
MPLPNAEGFIMKIVQPLLEFLFVFRDSLPVQFVVEDSWNLGNSFPSALFVCKRIKVLVVTQGFRQLEGWLNILRDFVVNLQVPGVDLVNVELRPDVSLMIK